MPCIALGHNFEYKYEWANALGIILASTPQFCMHLSQVPTTALWLAKTTADTATSETIMITEGIRFIIM